MRKIFVNLVVFFAVLFGIANVAQAIAFVDPLDFSGSGTYDGATYMNVTEDFLGGYSYTHPFATVPVGSVLNSANLSITHMGNSRCLFTELWLVGGEDHCLGLLSNSVSGWVTDTINLSSIVSDINAMTPLSLEVRLTNLGLFGEDTLKLDRSVITGDYSSPVPEPGSMLLFGSGILGILGMSFRKIGLLK